MNPEWVDFMLKLKKNNTELKSKIGFAMCANDSMKKTLLTSLYLAPIAYYKAFFNAEEVVMEQYNHYERKTYQNRCEILTANGKIALSVPVEKAVQIKIPFKEVRIAYHTDWRKQHLRALMSAYQNSPFYAYYIDDFLPLYEKQYDYLMDFNMALHQVILLAIDEKRPTTLTSRFYQDDDVDDLRFVFNPRKDTAYNLKPYTQVFFDKSDFMSNLSILDLLFNLGPETELYLKE